MIKTILVPATGSDRDTAVFASALAVARAFAAHLEFLHVRPDAAAMAVAMASDGGGATMVGGLINRLEEEADAARGKGKPVVPRLLRARRVGPPGCPARSAGPVGAVASGNRRRTLLGRGTWTRRRPLGHRAPGEDEGVSLDTIEGALIDSGRPLLIPPAAPLTALPETVAIAWKATREAARAFTAALPFLRSPNRLSS